MVGCIFFMVNARIELKMTICAQQKIKFQQNNLAEKQQKMRVLFELRKKAKFTKYGI